jgi:hypothetical protein
VRVDQTRDGAVSATAVPAALGLRAVRGGSVAVAVATDGEAPRVVLSTFLATAAEGDRLAFEPYHMAYEMERGPQGKVSAEAAAAVAEGRRRQAAAAASGLAGLVGTLEDAGCKPVLVALLVNRAGWMTDLLEHSLSAPEHPPVAEGLAVREALRFACARCALPIVEMDEKSLRESASTRLGLSPGEIDVALTGLGATVGRPWRKEQKVACLAAWLALTAA